MPGCPAESDMIEVLHTPPDKFIILLISENKISSQRIIIIFINVINKMTLKAILSRLILM